MSRIFISGSADGLGRAAADSLLEQGHHVILHARNHERATTMGGLGDRADAILVGDLSSASVVRALADQLNAIGRMDAVIHNAGVYFQPSRSQTPEGHATTLAVNTLAPYLLTALMETPSRLVYISSGMHRDAAGSLRDIDWTERTWAGSTPYSESKRYTTTIALAVARHWPDVMSNAVDPGWVPTKMGGAGAPDDLEAGHQTQAWLATSSDPAARISGGYWGHRQRRAPVSAAADPHFQNLLLAKLTALVGASLF